MRVVLAPEKEVWRGRGRPRREVPEKVKLIADQTFRSNQVQAITIGADEEEELAELMACLRSYASSRGCRILHQREGDTVLFKMVEIKRRKKAAA